MTAWHQDRVRALAPRQVAVGGLGAAPAWLTAQTLAAAGHDPGPGRRRPGLRIDSVGVFSNGGPFGEIHFQVGVGCDLLICCLPRSLRRIRVTRSRLGLPPGTCLGLK